MTQDLNTLLETGGESVEEEDARLRRKRVNEAKAVDGDLTRMDMDLGLMYDEAYGEKVAD